MWDVDRLPLGPGLLKRHGRLDLNYEDPRFTDKVDRVLPRPHAATHEDGGSDEITLTQSQITGLATALALLAPLASPALTGTPTAPTASGGTNTTQIATTAFVKAAIDALIGGAPGALDTLDELAAALADDASFAATITTALAGKSSTGHGHATLPPTPTLPDDIHKLLGVFSDGSVGWVTVTGASFPFIYDDTPDYDTAQTYDEEYV
jgi:hypothetical protein